MFKTLAFVITAAAVLFFYSSAYAIDGSTIKIKNDRAISSLKMGVQAGNYGVKRCCIYFAGEYKIDEMVDLLVEQLLKETDDEIRIDIALALLKIGNEAGLSALVKAAETDTNSFIRSIGEAVLDQSERFNFSSLDE